MRGVANENILGESTVREQVAFILLHLNVVVSGLGVALQRGQHTSHSFVYSSGMDSFESSSIPNVERTAPVPYSTRSSTLRTIPEIIRSNSPNHEPSRAMKSAYSRVGNLILDTNASNS